MTFRRLSVLVSLLVGLGLVLGSTPAWAINKCHQSTDGH